MDPELLVRVYEHDPDRRREAESLVGRDQARAVKGAIGRFANFFAAVAGGFDAGEYGWSFENVDFAYLRAPYLAGRQDADACVRLLLEDFAHYATLRKPRKGEDATLVFDEFSAIAGGREAAIQLVERVRDAGCALYLSAQSADGLGDEAQQRRLVGACSGGLLIHAMPDPETLLRAAGVVKVVEQTWRLDPQGPTGNSSARIGERPRIEPGAVQQAREGEAWYIARGRFEHLMVARTTISDGYRARAHAMVALALAAHRGLARRSDLGRGAGGRPGGPERPPRAPGHRAPNRPGRRRPRTVYAAGAERAGDGRPSAAPGRGRGRPRRRPGRHRHPGPPSPRPRRRCRRAAGGGRGSLAQAPPAPSRLASRTTLDRSSSTAPAPASRPSGPGRGGAPAMTEPRLRAVVSALVGAIAALAFLVSFRAISEFAVQTGAFPARLGWAAPLLVDSFTLAASIEVLRSALVAQRAVYPWCLVAGSTLASAALNIAHAPAHPAAQAVAGIPPVALLLALELLMRGARLYLGVHPVDSAQEPDTARERLRAWLAVNPSTPLTARQAAELLGVSRSRAGVLLQQERAGLNGDRGEQQ
jgi:hypothetical protein